MNKKKWIIWSALIIFGEIGPSIHANASFNNAPPFTSKLKNHYEPGNTDALQAGAKLFTTYCSSCHGIDAKGMGNVPALTGELIQTTPDGALFGFIRTGSPQNGMPPSDLPDNKLWEIVLFIKSLNKQAFLPSNEKSTAIKKGLKETNVPIPQTPFTDYRFEKPGHIHKILPQDLPPPSVETSTDNGPVLVRRPADAWPIVPNGFEVQLYASGLDNPRVIRTAPNGDVFLAESKSGKIKVFRGFTAQGKPKEVALFTSELNSPYGIAFYPPGNDPKWIYIGNTDAVIRFPYKTGDLRAKSPFQIITKLPSSANGHWTRDIQFSLDGKKMFVAVGSNSNIDDPDTHPEEKNRADILIMNPDGSDQRIYAYGIRNASGLAVNPVTGELWCSVNERDGLGDNLVPDYITHVREGGFYGWPWWYVGGHQDPRHVGKHPELKKELIEPDVLLQPHNASLQMAFYTGKQFPKDYSGDIFAAQHGSWNRSIRTGYELIRIPLHQIGKATGEYEDFMTGFVIDNRHVWGRPVGITVAADGSLLVSDDGSNSLWRIIYNGNNKNENN